MVREREKKRDRDRPNKPGAIFSIWGSVLEETPGGGREEERGEKVEESENILGSVYKENENTHTRRLGSQSECQRGAEDPAAT